MGFFRAKTKKSIGIFLLWNISFPQKHHSKTFGIKPERTMKKFELLNTIGYPQKAISCHNILLDGSVKITNTVNSMKHAAPIFLWPFQQLCIGSNWWSLSHTATGRDCSELQPGRAIRSVNWWLKEIQAYIANSLNTNTRTLHRTHCPYHPSQFTVHTLSYK